jgi:hypothetical protein
MVHKEHRVSGKLKSLSPKEWTGRMKDIPCFILGNAPSINDVNLSLLDNYFTIGINRIFYKYDPTILMWQDLSLWVQEKSEIMKTESIKYCRQGSETIGGFYTFKLSGREPRLAPDTTSLFGRGSSGSIAYQFARALYCDPIILVGMDCSYKTSNGGKITDFYGDNPMHKPHTIPNCIKGLNFIKDNQKGKIVYNCSYNMVFPERFTIEEVISKLPDKKYNREELKEILLNG